MRLRRQNSVRSLKIRLARRQQRLAALRQAGCRHHSQTAARPGTQSADQPPRRPTGLLSRGWSRTGERRHRVPKQPDSASQTDQIRRTASKAEPRDPSPEQKVSAPASDPQASDLNKAVAATCPEIAKKARPFGGAFSRAVAAFAGYYMRFAALQLHISRLFLILRSMPGTLFVLHVQKRETVRCGLPI